MSVRDEWQMQCVECDGDTLEVEVKVMARLYTDGTDIDGGDHEWDEQSKCYCIDCGWTGLVGQAKTAYDLKEEG